MDKLESSSCDRFTVLGAFYHKDDPEALKAALSSVYDSTLHPSQLILVQDGPVDPALTAVAKHFASYHGFELHILGENGGLARALNYGLTKVTNEFVMRIDADDLNEPNRFEWQIRELMSGADVTGGYTKEFDSDFNFVAVREVPKDHNAIVRMMKYRNPFNHPTVAFKKSSVAAVGGYPDLYLREDYGLWASLIASGAKASNLPAILVKQSGGDEMYKRRGGIRYAAAEYQLQKFLLRLGLQTISNAVIVGLLRSIVFVVPSKLRGFIYERLLRSSHQ